MKPSGWIALLTDFGTQDIYVGVMKGVIARMAPQAQILDICHEVPAHEVRVGSLFLASAVPYYPRGTVFVAVVDPGVGSERRPLGAQTEWGWFVAPDNGLLSDTLRDAHEVHVFDLTATARSLPRLSHTFHGRDLFAPVAARLVNGEPLERLGSPVSDWLCLPKETPEITSEGIRGSVLFADRFGNLITNIRRSDVTRPIATVRLGERDCGIPRTSYAHVCRGEWLAIWNSFDRLEIARSGMSAARACRWRLGVAMTVEVVFA